MIRKWHLCGLVLASMVCLAGRSGGETKILPEDSNRLLYTRQLQEAEKLYAQRITEANEAMKSPEAVRERAKRLLEIYRRNIGEMPRTKGPLNARVMSRHEAAGYRLENVVFESRPRHRVTANVFIPADGKGPFPAMIIACGHAPHGKIGYQTAGVWFALNGFVAAIYDPLGQGERQPMTTERPTTNHTKLLPGSLLVGRTVVGYSAWDGMRCIDYLLSRDDVDRSKPVGMTGNSGGGCQTNFLMALDDRIGPAAPSCYFTRKLAKFERLGPGDGCQNVPNDVLSRIDHADMAWIRAPKPTLILAAERDYVPISATREAAAEVANLYKSLGEADKTALFSHDDKHGFSHPRIEAAIKWMKRWVNDDTAPLAPLDAALLPQEHLVVLPSGQVRKEFDDERTVFQLNRARAEELAPGRREFWNHGKSEALTKVKHMIGSRKTAAEMATADSKGTLEREGYAVEMLVIAGPDGFPVPALLHVPTSAAAKRPAVIHVHDQGKSHPSATAEIETLARGGTIVLDIDVRGYGETADGMCKRRNQGRNYGVANLAIQLGRPLLGQRVDDILSAADVLKNRDDVGSIRLVGVGNAGPIALHAAALDERFESVTLRNSIRSWVQVLETADMDLGYAVFGALHRYDLPDLVRCISPRKVEFTAKEIRKPSGKR